MNAPTPSLEDAKECLQRSGYLLESRLVRQLVERDFFVEPNQAILDARTGKSREIDILAEHYHYEPNHSVSVKSHFVIEVSNNKFPIVLLTERPWSPVTDSYQEHLKVILTPREHQLFAKLDVEEERRVPAGSLFSQFCALAEKKSGNSKDPKELMASHPDDLYGSLLKLSEFVEDKLAHWKQMTENDPNDKCFRIFFWNPMLVVGGRFLVARIEADGNVALEEAKSAFLEFNWHSDGQPMTTAIEFVQADHFLSRLDTILKSDFALEVKANALFQQQGPVAEIKP